MTHVAPYMKQKNNETSEVANLSCVWYRVIARNEDFDVFEFEHRFLEML